MMAYTRVLSGLALLLAISGKASAAPCTAQDFAAAIDQSGASLRAFNRDAQPKLQDRMHRYAEAKKLPTAGADDAALDAIQDAKLASLDEKSGGLLLRIDSLGRMDQSATPDCAALDELKGLSRDLLAVMKEKSDYMLTRFDAKIAEAGGAAAPAKEAAAKPALEKPQDKVPEKAPAKPAEKAAPEKPTTLAAKPPETWSAETKSSDAFVPPPPGSPQQAPADVVAQSEVGYTIEEVQEATRGFFGTISTSLASVIEHAFKTTGRPSAYVLGTEGGGAFLAGLRFGEGTLYMRNLPGTRPVYWHGPSLGTDFGASGSRTMFLIYKMQQPDALFRTFTGVDGSAYFVGGVGVTLLKGGDVIMAPIRTGLGFRLGANVGYLRFVDKPTWNPF
jgi:hypothetical protein